MDTEVKMNTSNPVGVYGEPYNGVTTTTGVATSSGGIYQTPIKCGICGMSYAAGTTHWCQGTTALPYPPYPQQQYQQNPQISYSIDTEEEEIELEPLVELKRKVAEDIGMLETYLGFVEDGDQVEQLEEASYYLREVMKIIRRVNGEL